MNRKLLILFALLVSLYLTINFATPTNPVVLERYKMDAFEYQVMRAALVVPLIAVWFAALYGFSKLHAYAKAIQGSPDGKGFLWIASGLGVLAFGLPISSILGVMLSRSVAAGMIEQPVSTIISTHVSVGYQLVAFVLIAYGSRTLLRVLRKVKIPRKSIAIGAALLAVISVFYTISALNNPSRYTPVPPAETATYYMNDFLIFTTIIVPYIIAWTSGFFAFIAMRVYQQNVEGVLYQKALAKLNYGLIAIIGISILLQFLTAAVATLFAWQLGSLVVLLQLLVFAIGAGFVLVTIGAKGLTRLEEIK